MSAHRPLQDLCALCAVLRFPRDCNLSSVPICVVERFLHVRPRYFFSWIQSRRTLDNRGGDEVVGINRLHYIHSPELDFRIVDCFASLTCVDFDLRTCIPDYFVFPPTLSVFRAETSEVSVLTVLLRQIRNETLAFPSLAELSLRFRRAKSGSSPRMLHSFSPEDFLESAVFTGLERFKLVFLVRQKPREVRPMPVRKFARMRSFDWRTSLSIPTSVTQFFATVLVPGAEKIRLGPWFQPECPTRFENVKHIVVDEDSVRTLFPRQTIDENDVQRVSRMFPLLQRVDTKPYGGGRVFATDLLRKAPWMRWVRRIFAADDHGVPDANNFVFQLNPDLNPRTWLEDFGERTRVVETLDICSVHLGALVAQEEERRALSATISRIFCAHPELTSLVFHIRRDDSDHKCELNTLCISALLEQRNTDLSCTSKQRKGAQSVLVARKCPMS